MPFLVVLAVFNLSNSCILGDCYFIVTLQESQ